MPKQSKAEKEEPLEKKLWKAADKLRKNMDAAEYKHIVLGLIFLKYISDAFEELYEKLSSPEMKAEGADPEDKTEYSAEKVFYVPPSARWKWIQGRATLPIIGKDVDDAMEAIEKDNPSSLRGLTGFDAPCLHTLYVDKLMRGHTLMQAIARVNRVFKDKPGGLVVDYLGLAGDLKKALSFYGNAGGKGDPTEDIEGAVHVMMEKVEVVEQMFAEASRSRDAIIEESADSYNEDGFDFKRFFVADSRTKMEVILQAEEHLLGIEDGKNRFIREVSLLGQAFALTMPHPKAVEITERVAFFQAVKARLAKFEGGIGGGKTDHEIETAIRRIVDSAVRSDKVVDIFDAVGMDKPNISILSEEFLLEVKGMKHKNLGIELLKKILNDEISLRMKKNLVKSKAMLELLETAIKKYQNNLLSTAQIIEELLKIARDIRESDKDGERLGLTDDEVAFYNALEVNESAVKVLGDDTLREIAREIADKVKANATIDWTIRQSARDKIMVLVRRTLSKHGYPPDKQQKAVDTILKQAELFADSVISV